MPHVRICAGGGSQEPSLPRPAMKNEVLLKFLCHNIVVVHQAIIELGIEGTFWPATNEELRQVRPASLL